MADWTKNTIHSDVESGDRQVGEVMGGILRLLEGGERVQVVAGQRPNDRRMPENKKKAWAITPTHIRWKPQGRTIALQLNGSHYRANLKDFSGMQITEMLNFVASMGYQGVQVGLPLSLEESVMSMAEADIFIGIDSGMAHVAYSVGLPVIIVQNRIPDSYLLCHRERYVRLFATGESLIAGLTRKLCEELKNSRIEKAAESVRPTTVS